MVESSQTLLIGYENMDGSMAVSTDGDSLRHLGACEPFAKPFVAMATAWDEMMLRRAFEHLALAQVTRPIHFVNAHKPLGHYRSSFDLI